MLPLLLLMACPRPAPPPPPAVEPAPLSDRVAAYQLEVERVCAEARSSVSRRAAATTCSNAPPARWEAMVAESFQWMDQSRRPIEPQELGPTQMQGEVDCAAVEAEPLSEAELAELEGIAALAAQVAAIEGEEDAAWRARMEGLEALHGACLGFAVDSM